jgi:arylformamidase
MEDPMNWIDVSLPMRADTVHWPGHPWYTVTEMMSMDRGDIMNVSAVSMCSHFGTHIDAPRHYVAAGTTVDELSPDTLIGPCRVVAYRGEGHIPAAFIDGLDLGGLTRLFIQTANSERLARPEFYEDYIALTVQAARALVEKGVKLLGVDGYSIGPFDPALGIPVHSIFLGAGPQQAAIEEANLLGVEPGDYQVIALPIRLTGLEGAPARVLLGRA